MNDYHYVLGETKVTQIYRMADDLCKEFTLQWEEYIMV